MITFSYFCFIFSIIKPSVGQTDSVTYNYPDSNGDLSNSDEYSCEKYAFSEFDISCLCNSTYCDSIGSVVKPEEGRYLMYTTDRSGLRFFKQQGQFDSEDTTAKEEITFTIDRSKREQSIFGFGGAFTDAAGINILSLSEPAQENILRSYFSPSGIEFNFGRVPIGGCDFSTRPYSYDDTPGDVNLKNFSLAYEDYNYKIPVIKRALSMSRKGINLLGTSWSSPPWTKTSNSFTAGSLKNEYMQYWANYHIKFLEAYKMEGLNFWGITTANEPSNGFLSEFVHFNTMAWYPEMMAVWLAENLGPTLKNSQFHKLKVLCHDDQRYLLPAWVSQIFSNQHSSQYVDGIGVHWYADKISSPDIIRNLRNSLPDKFIMNTEASQGTTLNQVKLPPGTWFFAEDYAQDIIQDIQAGMSGWLEWNLAVDMNAGPNWTNGSVWSPILVDAQNDVFFKNPIFYALGQFSKFIDGGAVKIESSPDSYDNVMALACLNNDGSVAVVLLNRGSEGVGVKLVDKEKRENATIFLKEHSINTILYQ